MLVYNYDLYHKPEDSLNVQTLLWSEVRISISQMQIISEASTTFFMQKDITFQAELRANVLNITELMCPAKSQMTKPYYVVNFKFVSMVDPKL